MPLEVATECPLEVAMGCPMEVTTGFPERMARACPLGGAMGCPLEVAMGCPQEVAVGCLLEVAMGMPPLETMPYMLFGCEELCMLSSSGRFFMFSLLSDFLMYLSCGRGRVFTFCWFSCCVHLK